MLLTRIGVARPRVLIALLALSSLVTARGVEAQQGSGSTTMSHAVARSIPATPDSRHVFVLDSAHLLTAPEIAALQDSAVQLQTATGADIAFVTLPTLHGGAVEEAALTIGRSWKVGSAGNAGDPTRNRGLVMLYVPDKKSVAGANLRVEVGRGLEGAITDGGGSRAILEAIKPPFRQKRYGDGFIAGFNVAARLIIAENAAQPIATPTPVRPVARDSDGFPWSALLFVPIGLLVAAAIFIRRRNGPLIPDLTQRGPSWPHSAGSGVVPFQMFDQTPTSSSSDSGSSSSDSSSSTDSGSSSDGGSFGGGGDFSGGGSSDSV